VAAMAPAEIRCSAFGLLAALRWDGASIEPEPIPIKVEDQAEPSSASRIQVRSVSSPVRSNQHRAQDRLRTRQEVTADDRDGSFKGRTGGQLNDSYRREFTAERLRTIQMLGTGRLVIPDELRERYEQSFGGEVLAKSKKQIGEGVRVGSNRAQSSGAAQSPARAGTCPEVARRP
jgi:hypothetical protein